MPRSSPRAPLALLILLVALAAALLPTSALAAEPASGDGIVPQFKPGNQTCATLLPSGDVLSEYKHDPPNDATVPLTIGGFSTTLTFDKRSTPAGEVMDWSITGTDLVVSAVFVKASNGGNLYDYRPNGDNGDTDLHGPVAPSGTYHEISHVSFCFKVKPVNPPDPDPTVGVIKRTTQSGQQIASADPFTINLAGGGLNEAPVLDTDPLSVPSDQAGPFTVTGQSKVVTVSESNLPAGWTLADLACVGAGQVEYGVLGGAFDATFDTGDNAARLTLQNTDTAICTFTNDKAPDAPPPGVRQDPPPVVTSTPPPAAVAPAVVSAPSLVRPAAPRAPRVVAGTARLRAPQGCRSNVFTVRVAGRQIRRVTISLDGRTLRTFRTSRRTYSVRVDPRKLGDGPHRIAVTVLFTQASRTRARTLRSTFQRCLRRQVAPRFTG